MLYIYVKDGGIDDGQVGEAMEGKTDSAGIVAKDMMYGRSAEECAVIEFWAGVISRMLLLPRESPFTTESRQKISEFFSCDLFVAAVAANATLAEKADAEAQKEKRIRAVFEHPLFVCAMACANSAWQIEIVCWLDQYSEVLRLHDRAVRAIYCSQAKEARERQVEIATACVEWLCGNDLLIKIHEIAFTYNRSAPVNFNVRLDAEWAYRGNFQSVRVPAPPSSSSRIGSARGALGPTSAASSPRDNSVAFSAWPIGTPSETLVQLCRDARARAYRVQSQSFVDSRGKTRSLVDGHERSQSQPVHSIISIHDLALPSHLLFLDPTVVAHDKTSRRTQRDYDMSRAKEDRPSPVTLRGRVALVGDIRYLVREWRDTVKTPLLVVVLSDINWARATEQDFMSLGNTEVYIPADPFEREIAKAARARRTGSGVRPMRDDDDDDGRLTTRGRGGAVRTRDDAGLDAEVDGDERAISWLPAKIDRTDYFQIMYEHDMAVLEAEEAPMKAKMMKERLQKEAAMDEVMAEYHRRSSFRQHVASMPAGGTSAQLLSGERQRRRLWRLANPGADDARLKKFTDYFHIMAARARGHAEREMWAGQLSRMVNLRPDDPAYDDDSQYDEIIFQDSADWYAKDGDGDDDDDMPRPLSSWSSSNTFDIVSKPKKKSSSNAAKRR